MVGKWLSPIQNRSVLLRVFTGESIKEVMEQRQCGTATLLNFGLPLTYLMLDVSELLFIGQLDAEQKIVHYIPIVET